MFLSLMKRHRIVFFPMKAQLENASFASFGRQRAPPPRYSSLPPDHSSSSEQKRLSSGQNQATINVLSVSLWDSWERRRSMKMLFLAVFACIAASGLASAQSAVGRALVDGKVVTLFDNGTWKHAGAAATVDNGCVDITPEVQFCNATLGWATTTAASPEINAAFRIDDRHYAQFLIEKLGSDDGLTADFMRKAVIMNAQDVTGSEPEVIDIVPVSLGALNGDTVVYRVTFDGIDIVFSNSLFTTPKRTFQIMTYAISSEYTLQHAEYQADLLSNTTLLE